MERIGQEKQLYAGRRTCAGQEVEVCLSHASSEPEANAAPRPPDVCHQISGEAPGS